MPLLCTAAGAHICLAWCRSSPPLWLCSLLPPPCSVLYVQRRAVTLPRPHLVPARCSQDAGGTAAGTGHAGGAAGAATWHTASLASLHPPLLLPRWAEVGLGGTVCGLVQVDSRLSPPTARALPVPRCAWRLVVCCDQQARFHSISAALAERAAGGVRTRRVRLPTAPWQASAAHTVPTRLYNTFENPMNEAFD